MHINVHNILFSFCFIVFICSPLKLTIKQTVRVIAIVILIRILILHVSIERERERERAKELKIIEKALLILLFYSTLNLT